MREPHETPGLFLLGSTVASRGRLIVEAVHSWLLQGVELSISLT
jgi:hypothetical protein